jgi:hypothetical protein
MKEEQNTVLGYHLTFDFLKIASSTFVAITLIIALFFTKDNQLLLGVLITLLSVIVGGLMSLKGDFREKGRDG